MPISSEAQQRAGEREEAGEDEGPRDTALGARHARQRLAHADRHQRTGVRASAGDAHRALEQAQIADVGQAKVENPSRTVSSLRESRFS